MKTLIALSIAAFLTLANFASAGEWHIKTDCVATKNKADMDLPMQMMVDKDFHALAEFIMEGNGIMLSPKSRISVVKEEDWGTNWQIRLKGSSKIWWLSVEFLQPPPEDNAQSRYRRTSLRASNRSHLWPTRFS